MCLPQAGTPQPQSSGRYWYPQLSKHYTSHTVEGKARSSLLAGGRNRMLHYLARMIEEKFLVEHPFWKIWLFGVMWSDDHLFFQSIILQSSSFLQYMYIHPFLQIILVLNGMVAWNWINQQRRPLPSLLSEFYSMIALYIAIRAEQTRQLLRQPDTLLKPKKVSPVTLPLNLVSISKFPGANNLQFVHSMPQKS